MLRNSTNHVKLASADLTRLVDNVKSANIGGLKVRTNPTFKPRLAIFGIPGEKTEEQLVADISSHPVVEKLLKSGENMRMVKLIKKEGAPSTAIVEVNKEVETALLERGRITIDFLSLRLARAKRVFPCGVCGSLSHKTHTNGKKCTRAAKCSHCAGAHLSETCENKTVLKCHRATQKVERAWRKACEPVRSVLKIFYKKLYNRFRTSIRQAKLVHPSMFNSLLDPTIGGNLDLGRRPGVSSSTPLHPTSSTHVHTPLHLRQPTQQHYTLDSPPPTCDMFLTNNPSHLLHLNWAYHILAPYADSVDPTLADGFRFALKKTFAHISKIHQQRLLEANNSTNLLTHLLEQKLQTSSPCPPMPKLNRNFSIMPLTRKHHLSPKLAPLPSPPSGGSSAHRRAPASTPPNSRPPAGGPTCRQTTSRRPTQSRAPISAIPPETTPPPPPSDASFSPGGSQSSSQDSSSPIPSPAPDEVVYRMFDSAMDPTFGVVANTPSNDPVTIAHKPPPSTTSKPRAAVTNPRPTKIRPIPPRNNPFHITLTQKAEVLTPIGSRLGSILPLRSLGVPILYVSATNSKITLHTKNKEDLATLTNIVTPLASSLELDLIRPPTFHQRFTVFDIPADTPDSSLTDIFLSGLENSDNKCSLIRTIGTGRNTKHAVFEVGPTNASLLHNRAKTFFGYAILSIAKTRATFPCRKCGTIGHKTPACKWSPKCLHCGNNHSRNCNRSIPCFFSSIHTALSSGIDLLLLQELPVRSGRIPACFPVPASSYLHAPILNNKCSSCIIVLNLDLPILFLPKISTVNRTIAVVDLPNFHLTICSLYLPCNSNFLSATESLSSLLGSPPPPNLILAGVANAESARWSLRRPNRKGDHVNDLLDTLQLYVCNRMGTITRRLGSRESSIDISCVSNHLSSAVSGWKAEECALSDHFQIFFSLDVPDLGPPPSPHPRLFPDFSSFNLKSPPPRRLFLALNSIFSPDSSLSTALDSCDSAASLDQLIDLLYSLLHLSCSQNLSPKTPLPSFPPPVPWSILNAKKRHFREFTSSFTHNPWGPIHRYVARGFSVRNPFCSRRFETLTTQQNVNANLKDILDVYFSEPPPNSGPSHLLPSPPIPSTPPPPEIPFSTLEFHLALRALNPKKSHGSDLMPGQFAKWLLSSFSTFFFNLFNKCFSLRHFPKLWKVGRVVLVPKKSSGEDFTSQNRPIVLLPILGKTLESMLSLRLSHHFESNGLLHPNQFGFRKGRSALDALALLKTKISESIRSHQCALLISLDIKSAFDHLWHPSFLTQLTAAACPPTLQALYHSFLSDRTVTLSYKKCSSSKLPSRGCPQGSRSGPHVWNIAFNPVLSLPYPPGVHIQAFADDLQIVVSGPPGILTSRAQLSIDLVSDWCLDNKLTLTPHKSEVLPIFTNPPSLTLQDTVIPWTDRLRALGVVFNDRFTFDSHLQWVCDRALSILGRLKGCSNARSGLGFHARRRLYIGAIEPAITYGAPIWADAVKTSAGRSQLRSTQRKFCLHAIRGFRTVPLLAAIALLRILPLDLKILLLSSLSRPPEPLPFQVERDLLPSSTRLHLFFPISPTVPSLLAHLTSVTSPTAPKPKRGLVQASPEFPLPPLGFHPCPSPYISPLTAAFFKPKALPSSRRYGTSPPFLLTSRLGSSRTAFPFYTPSPTSIQGFLWCSRYRGCSFPSSPIDLSPYTGSKAMLGSSVFNISPLSLLNEHRFIHPSSQVITGFLTGHSFIGSYRYSRRDLLREITCPDCHLAPETVEHIFFNCPHLDDLRATLFNSCLSIAGRIPTTLSDFATSSSLWRSACDFGNNCALSPQPRPLANSPRLPLPSVGALTAFRACQFSAFQMRRAAYLVDVRSSLPLIIRVPDTNLCTHHWITLSLGLLVDYSCADYSLDNTMAADTSASSAPTLGEFPRVTPSPPAPIIPINSNTAFREGWEEINTSFKGFQEIFIHEVGARISGELSSPSNRFFFQAMNGLLADLQNTAVGILQHKLECCDLKVAEIRAELTALKKKTTTVAPTPPPKPTTTMTKVTPPANAGAKPAKPSKPSYAHMLRNSINHVKLASAEHSVSEIRAKIAQTPSLKNCDVAAVTGGDKKLVLHFANPSEKQRFVDNVKSANIGGLKVQTNPTFKPRLAIFGIPGEKTEEQLVADINSHPAVVPLLKSGENVKMVKLIKKEGANSTAIIEVNSLSHKTYTDGKKCTRAAKCSHCAGAHLSEACENKAALKCHRHAKSAEWRRICSLCEVNPWGGVYKFIKGSTKRKPLSSLLVGEDLTDSPRDTLEHVLKHYFGRVPPDITVEHVNLHKAVQSTSENDPPFSETELLLAADKVSLTSAPGSDGMPPLVIVKLIKKFPTFFLKIFNKCFETGHFPTPWKLGDVILIPKKGGEDFLASHRPITMLPGLGKILERLILARLSWRAERMCKAQPNQFGFRPCRSTVAALLNLKNNLSRSLQHRKSTILLSFDVKGAFDNVLHSSILRALCMNDCPKNLFVLIRSFLYNRVVRLSMNGCTVTRQVSKGCPQGSVLGPFLWNLVFDELLTLNFKKCVHPQAYADDLVMVVSGQVTQQLGAAQLAINEITRWCGLHKLELSVRKCQAMLLLRRTGRLLKPSCDLTINGQPIQWSDSIKVLGVRFDRRLAFHQHVVEVCTRVRGFLPRLTAAANSNFGFGFRALRMLYLQVVVPAISYASPVWFPNLKQRSLNTLLSAQRPFLIRTCRAFKTTDSYSLISLSRVLPLDLDVGAKAELYFKKHSFVDADFPVEPPPCPHPLPYPPYYSAPINIPDLSADVTYYTDGSKTRTGVGTGLYRVCANGSMNELRESFVLSPYCSVFQAEALGLIKALEDASKLPDNYTIEILLDNLSVVKSVLNTRTGNLLVNRALLLISQLNRNGNRCTIQWIKGHSGIFGNEVADVLAKRGADSDLPSCYRLAPLSKLKSIIYKRAWAAWHGQIHLRRAQNLHPLWPFSNESLGQKTCPIGKFVLSAAAANSAIFSSVRKSENLSSPERPNFCGYFYFFQVFAVKTALLPSSRPPARLPYLHSDVHRAEAPQPKTPRAQCAAADRAASPTETLPAGQDPQLTYSPDHMRDATLCLTLDPDNLKPVSSSHSRSLSPSPSESESFSSSHSYQPNTIVDIEDFPLPTISLEPPPNFVAFSKCTTSNNCFDIFDWAAISIKTISNSISEFSAELGSSVLSELKGILLHLRADYERRISELDFSSGLLLQMASQSKQQHFAHPHVVVDATSATLAEPGISAISTLATPVDTSATAAPLSYSAMASSRPSVQPASSAPSASRGPVPTQPKTTPRFTLTNNPFHFTITQDPKEAQPLSLRLSNMSSFSALGAPGSHINTSRDKITIHTRSKEDFTKLHRKLVDLTKNTNIKISTPPSFHHRFTIFNVPDITNEEDLTTMFVRSVECQDTDCRLIRTISARNGRVHAVFETNNIIATALEGKKRIYFGFSSLSIDRTRATFPCRSCGSLRHRTNSCSGPVRCLHCGLAHKIADCPTTGTSPSCFRCKPDQNGHRADSFACPVIRMVEETVDILLLQELPVSNNRLPSAHPIPPSSILHAPISNNKCSAAIVVLNQVLPVLLLPKLSTVNRVLAVVDIPNFHFTICSVYIPCRANASRTAESFTNLFGSPPPPNLLFAGDFNAESNRWSNRHRAKGTHLNFMLDSLNLAVCNRHGAITRAQGSSSSSIDVTCITSSLLSSVSGWDAVEWDLSDHFEISFSVSTPDLDASPLSSPSLFPDFSSFNLKSAPPSRLFLSLQSLLSPEGALQVALNNCDSAASIECFVGTFYELLHMCCSANLSPKGPLPAFPPPNPWWSPKLQSLKTLSRRLGREYKNFFPPLRDRLRERCGVLLKRTSSTEQEKLLSKRNSNFITFPTYIYIALLTDMQIYHPFKRNKM
ncbi:hypothetical protein LAZ67_22000090 [Cordylochernes scorpioides]|uniref:Reverse transcriptase n=1 Tax=Cordylochernes scorpioides TaxID=51811 RepID=A0ABY6LN49_9ARAC|nr:hypothetical protein LAZ67_22000090 [Cordylochernes scorpioides]